MKFLLTNDDGIEAPGLAALCAAASPHGEPIIIAPDRHLSGCSHQTTTSTPIHFTAIDSTRHSLIGTPADCVRIGLLHFAPEVEWVLSGVNDGGNMGVDVYMSGTVAAAREAALMGRRSIAFSQYRTRQREIDWHWVAEIVDRVFSHLRHRPLPKRAFWNVNLPDVPVADELPSIVFCPLDPHPLHVAFDNRDGAFHFRGEYQKRQHHANTDVGVCFSGRIAVTQVFLDGAAANG